MKMGLRTGMAATAIALCLGATSLPALADGVTDGNAGREALLKGDYDNAIKLFSRAIAFGGLNAKNQAITLNLRGNAYLERGQTEVALDDLNESLRIAETPDARFTRAKVFIAQFRFDDAIQDLTKAMALGGQAADVYALRGHAQLYAGRIPEALKDLDTALQLQPNYGFALRTRGHAYMNGGQDDKAIADETRAIQQDPKDVEAHWLRGYAYRYRKHDLAKAVADYTAALAIDPDDSSNRTSRADAYEEMGRYDLAAADYDAWIKRNPKGPFGYWARGRLELITGKPAAAAADLAKAVVLKPTDAYNMLWLHLARAKAGADDSAELAANAAKISHAIWPAPLVDYLTGKADAAQVLAKAGQGEGKAKATQTCEALMFLGQDDLAKGRKAEGLDRLQTAERGCDGASREARLIKAELRGSPAPRPTVVADTSSPKPAPAPVRKAAPASSGVLDLRGSLK